MEHPRIIVARWIEERRQERDLPALSWIIQRAAAALLGCFPTGEGRDALWALFRTIAGEERTEGETR